MSTYQIPFDVAACCDEGGQPLVVEISHGMITFTRADGSELSVSEINRVGDLLEQVAEDLAYRDLAPPLTPPQGRDPRWAEFFAAKSEGASK